ncbi:1-(5-phosphoribosyl)-5-[(5-phosphoribosylamino)methylideneamino]imidazole-4-carboxamide isomerase [Gammaproteobacteria bacterium AB-CW1]|uniref:1-(5-phosphoribosyl)-5-[(5-phosphoribosylamino)methylideneamino] imidazole-4-carboxamide isomerase n=1 Tax=Natronospira elongata TaxID=3110268 RepID=A0AAP6JDP9_9GAMM|nr:1-(5-phosphoribosyl)-5-[(5-phosphoribosylamino)methylideneamino]imidazole-4-carboxamide isomerase [Gammaproteobacteria bacterium AB-CW1]
MLVIPAIDIQDGRCVRLRQGKLDDATVFSEDPAEVARRWVEAGAERVHVVDLDGAKAGRPVNDGVVRDIVAACGDIPVQVGGGIRDEDSADAYLSTGVEWVIIGTKAVNTPHFVEDLCVEYPGRIIVGLDARDGKVAIDAWSKLSEHDVLDLAQKYEGDGVCAIIFTDISKDGMMAGPAVDSTAELARSINIPVIASGGVSKLDDLKALATYQEEGIQGAIVGRAIYDGGMDLAEAIRHFHGDPRPDESMV